MITLNFKCRFCDSSLKEIFVDLGMSPLANAYLKSDKLNDKEAFFPLRVYVCTNCFLVQLPEFESPEKIFSDYAYFSSYSESWLKHAENYVNEMLDIFGFNSNSQIIEIASNDGYLLQYFKKKKIPVLGIEPASNVAKIAVQKGIPTIVKFFNTKTAKELLKEKKQADLIVGNNVLAHVPNLNDFVEGLRILLKSQGMITMEFPHLLQLIKQNQFDTIYHEHFSYFSLITVQKVFSFHGLKIIDVKELSTHGGSLRIFATHEKNNVSISKSVSNLIEQEKLFGLEHISIYKNFSEKVKAVKQNIRDFFISIKSKGKKIVCYGASAKGNTFLNYCGIGSDFIDYVVDLSPHKQGLFLPGTHLPIKNPERLRETKPDFVLITPWNLKDEIIQQMSYIREWRGKFIVSIPEVKIID